MGRPSQRTFACWRPFAARTDASTFAVRSSKSWSQRDDKLRGLPRKPAAFQVMTPLRIIQVAAV